MNSILYLRQIKDQLKNIDNLPDNISGIKNVLSTITNKTDIVRGG